MELGSSSYLFPDEFMLVSLIVGAFVIVYFLYVERDNFKWTTAVWLLPMLWLILFYGILTFNIDPIANDPRLRVALYRPGFWFLLVFVLLDKLNGRVNVFIDSAIEGVKWFSASIRRRL